MRCYSKSSSSSSRLGPLDLLLRFLFAMACGMPEHGVLTEDELAAKLSYDSLLDMSDRFPDHCTATAKALNFNDINALNAGFKTTHSYNDATIELKASDSDKEFVMPIAKVLAGLLAPATVALWQQEAEKDVKRGMNAAIRAKLRPQLQAQTALDVSSALSNMGHENQEQQLSDGQGIEGDSRRNKQAAPTYC